MSETRLFQAVPLQINAEIKLDENASHHLSKVLRANVNDAVIIFNGTGGEYFARIKQIDKKFVTVLLEKFIDRNPESPLEISLVQGISRGEKMDFTIQKAVELGVKEIVPLLTERCNVKLDGERLIKKVEHWQRVAISAAEQSGRISVPRVEIPVSLSKWLEKDQSAIKFVLAPTANHSLKQTKMSSKTTLSLLIGPEGGLSETEINQAVKAGFTPLNLGPRILRTETAGLAAISIVQSHYGDMR